MRAAANIAVVVACVTLIAVPAGACPADVFDGSGSYASFTDLTAGYNSFMGTPQNKIDFTDLPLTATSVGNFYAATKGVTFSNEGTSMMLPEGSQVVNGWYQGSMAGYGDKNMPAHGAPVYNKIWDTDPGSPLTISFASPVNSVGGYIANSAGGPSSLTINAYDAAGDLLSTVSANVNPWGDCDNIEGYWGIKGGKSNIASITILSAGNYGVASLGWLDWNGSGVGGGATPTPEPCTMAILAIGGVTAAVRRHRRA